MQMPTHVYVYGPDDEEGWYYENEIPEGWVRTKPEEKSYLGDTPPPEESEEMKKAKAAGEPIAETCDSPEDVPVDPPQVADAPRPDEPEVTSGR